jgi:1,4-alpha-glucan branching enzyme
MVQKMPGDQWQHFANLRLLYGFMTGHPGKKLLFMGDEFAQLSEWNHDSSLEWYLLDLPEHQGILQWVQHLNFLIKSHPELYQLDFQPEGFEWIDCNDYVRSVVSFSRWGKDRSRTLIFVCNFTPVVRTEYRIGVPWPGVWQEILNSDAEIYGGSGVGNLGKVQADDQPAHGRPCSLNLTLPPLSILVFEGVKPPEPETNSVVENSVTAEQIPVHEKKKVTRKRTSRTTKKKTAVR